MKKCFKCNKKLSLTHFYKHAQMKDGYLNKCKDCAKSDVIMNRLNKLNYYRKYDIERAKTEKRITLNRTIVRNYRTKHPERLRANNAIQRAKSKGKLKSQPCQKCGQVSNVHAHHDDYSKPLDIIWLCSVHHKARHKELKLLGTQR